MGEDGSDDSDDIDDLIDGSDGLGSVPAERIARYLSNAAHGVVIDAVRLVLFGATVALALEMVANWMTAISVSGSGPTKAIAYEFTLWASSIYAILLAGTCLLACIATRLAAPGDGRSGPVLARLSVRLLALVTLLTVAAVVTQVVLIFTFHTGFGPLFQLSTSAWAVAGLCVHALGSLVVLIAGGFALFDARRPREGGV